MPVSLSMRPIASSASNQIERSVSKVAVTPTLGTRHVMEERAQCLMERMDERSHGSRSRSPSTGRSSVSGRRTHGPGVMVIVNEPGPESSSDDLHEYRPAFAGRVRSRLICDGEGAWIEVSGRAGRCAYGEGPAAHSPEFQEAYQWLYGEPSA